MEKLEEEISDLNEEEILENLSKIEKEKEKEEELNQPLLYVDVNLGNDNSERICIYEGDNSEDLADIFAEKHS